ncbi:hypothetical protein RN607_13440 [Demequina capsici]|uniref:Uncharacterized protein n=1 Tax=Demequina capsici TaxID=3075620 RepID=A0AA96FBG6_9MICO|nr:hypothetical protein [Demequina sp. PMTSA13]WNM27189.1 hypothetical protein RN607_13440 [Demequina sp. PMTSA13]
MIRRLRTGSALVLVAALGLATFAAVAAPAPAAQAVTAAGFNPGMIITDDLFYDSDAMTATEVQAFLDRMVPVCKDPDLSNDITCLKDYSTTTVARSAAITSGKVLCSEIPAQTATAAEVIDLVARACGVSQKVLLVLLQKEQGLVTATDPGIAKYNKATGYACPDTGSCDTKYYGLFNQLYWAAWQYRYYQATASTRSYVAGQYNSIGYHPSSWYNPPLCGKATVYIQNQATAGLYIYTPYVPNAAALTAGYGTGDSCSSYGNRNFYNYYTDWFGSTTRIFVGTALASTYFAAGGSSTVGDPTGYPVQLTDNGGGWYQEFDNGVLYYSTAAGTGVFLKYGTALYNAYISAGGPSSTTWGWPLTGYRCYDSLCAIEFQLGVMTQTGTSAIAKVDNATWATTSPWRFGTDSLTVRRENAYYIKNTLGSGSADVTLYYGRADDAVLVGDWDGDGVDTLMVRRGNAYYVKNTLAGGDADKVLYYGRADDVVLVGDWDGDGVDTLAVRRGQTYYVKNSLNGGSADVVVNYGLATDQVLVGDWDGDGVDTLAVRRGQTYYVKNTIAAGGADLTFNYGRADDAVLVGDWDGDLRDTLAVRRGQTYYFRNQLGAGSADLVVNYGRADDVVLVGDWDGDGAFP